MLSNKTIDLIKTFMEKYNVDVDVEDIEDIVNDFNNLENTKPLTNDYGIKAYNSVEEKATSAIAEYRASYKDMLRKYVRTVSANENLSTSELITDFENLMNNIVYIETSYIKTQSLATIANGGMNNYEYADLVNENSRFPTRCDQLLNSFKGKHTEQINTELREKYLGEDKKPSFDELIGVAQAISQRNDKRGFFGRIWNFRKSNLEKNLIKDIKQRARDLYPNKDIENAMLNKNIYSDEIQDKQADVEQALENSKISMDKAKEYDLQKYQELKRNYESFSKLNQDAARIAAENKYQNKIKPIFMKAMLENRPLSSTKKEIKEIQSDGYRLYVNRFEKEINEKYNKELKPIFDYAHANKLNKSVVIEMIGKNNYEMYKNKFKEDHRAEKEAIKKDPTLEKKFKEAIPSKEQVEELVSNLKNEGKIVENNVQPDIVKPIEVKEESHDNELINDNNNEMVEDGVLKIDEEIAKGY